MAADFSDYTKPRTKIQAILPEVFNSNTAVSVYENSINRFLTKNETKKVAGYVGQGNPNAVIKRQLVEPTIDRQADQLQPILNAKVGSVTHFASWKDIETKLTQLGVDLSKQNVWGAVQEFNWIPPIDIDKLINYQNYYWYDAVTPNSQPDYIVIRNECTQATAYANFWEQLTSLYGTEFPIVGVTAPNELVIAGNFLQPFSAGFSFFVRDTSNTDINGQTLIVSSSTYDNATNQTTIVVTNTFTDTTSGGVISLAEALTAALASRDCICQGTMGWDQTQWDDNPNDAPSPIWGNPPNSQPGLIAAITHTFPPSATPPTSDVQDVLWYDTTADQLYQWSGTVWAVVVVNFSTVLINTTGNNPWDNSTGCASSTTIIPAAEQWITANKWIHKTDVPNFTVAKRAQFPIIEFAATLELNEWVYTSFNWQYRSNVNVAWADVPSQPALIELESLGLVSGTSSSKFIIDEAHGDLTAYFTPGRLFAASNDPLATNNSSTASPPYSLVRPIQVTRSYFVQLNGNEVFQTVVEVTPVGTVDSTYRLIPVTTSAGDPWKGYNIHWLFESANDPVPVNHQLMNSLLAVSGGVLTTVGNYQYTSGPYSQDNTLVTNGPTPEFDLSSAPIAGSSRPLNQRALLGFDDIRVYVNGVRQYGTYDEVSSDSVHVTGIVFLTGFIPSAAGTSVRIEVGEAAESDFGLSAVPVMTSSGIQIMSLVSYRKDEQIKTGVNQYPLFDLYNPDGTSAHKATQIFGYETSPTDPVVPAVGVRLVQSTAPIDFGFEQYLIDIDNGNLYAYRDYANRVDNYWVDTETNIVYVWDAASLIWNPRFMIEDSAGNTYYTTATAGAAQPQESDEIDGNLGYLWYDTTAGQLKIRTGTDNSPSDFEVTSNVGLSTFDETLQTIWKDGKNNEQFIPAQVDWENRTLAEYDAEQTTFVADQIAQGITESVALQNWFTSQINKFSSTGAWVGDWEVPDPLYYNNLHENRKIVTYRQLLSHFNSVVDAQPTIPGFTGPKTNMFHLLPFDQVNFGLGGKIKEYNDGFDTFLSAIFGDTVNPLTLIDFAHEQYESLLNNLRVTYSQNLLAYLTTISQSSLLDLGDYISDQVITNVEENENLALLYGDSSTFNQVTGLGIRNWIDTLVYIKLIGKSFPVHLIDVKRKIDFISHHDTHFENYALTSNIVEGTSRLVTQQPDNRNGPDTFGRISQATPPSTITAFASAFATSIVNREGVYWYSIPSGTSRTLYRLTAVNSGPVAPVTNLADGVLWIDTNTNTLRKLSAGTWIPVTSVGDGIIASAWQIIDLNVILNAVVVSVETKLFENAPDVLNVPYDLTTLPSLDPVTYETYSLQAFLDYVANNNIAVPFKNVDYDATKPFTWNYTYSTVGLGHEIIDSSFSPASFTISDPEGFFQPTFVAGETFFVKNSLSTNDGEWTIASSGAVFNSSTGETTIFVVTSPTHSVVSNVFGALYRGDLLPSSNNTGAESAGDWQALYQAFYNTPYPHLEPWKLQGFYGKPSWWDAQYADTTGTRRWKPIMWTNIQTGVVPPGQDYPIGVTSITGIPAMDRMSPNLLDVPDLPVFHYFSVNVSNAAITGLDGITYNPDDVYPPFWAGPFTMTNRSLFTDINEIISASADFIFGKPGPTEWQWISSSQYLYDQLEIGFRMDPVRFVSHTFGKKFLIVDDLQIDSDTNNTFSHTRTSFHGDIVNDKEYTIEGLNQWYVDYNRYLDIDTSYSDFRVLWTGWTAPMTYQLSSFVDTNSFILGHRTVDVSTFDWTIATKHTTGVHNYWLDALKMTVLNIPPSISRYNNEKQWEFELDTNLPVSRTINYYDVQNYQFYNLFELTNSGAQIPSNTFSIYTYPVMGTDTINNTFLIAGDQTDSVKAGQTFTVFNSTNNDGEHTILNAAYDQLEDITIVSITGIVNAGTIIQDFGMMKLNYRALSWSTGDMIYISTDETSPLPLFNENYYFVIMLSPTEFQLAQTQNDATNNVAIDITSVGRRNQYAGKLQNTFVALDGQTTGLVWKHYLIDKTNTLTLTTPFQFSGVQSLVNIVDGYDSWTYDQGWRVNASGELRDPTIQNRTVSWQLEVERFINFIYGARQTRNLPIPNTYAFSANTVTSECTFTTHPGQFVTGDAVMLDSQHLVFPSPLLGNIKYYIVVDSVSTFRLAGTQLDAMRGNAIALENATFVGSLSIFPAPTRQQGVLTFEINPFRNGIWFNPPEGIVSNIFTGPSDDVRTTQLVFDQYGRPLSNNTTRVLRQDQQTEILVADDVPNDVQLTTIFNDPYNFLHLGGLHLFVDTYENVVVFNDYTTEGQLLYDPFVGLNVTKFELQFLAQVNFTERPNVGGFFLKSVFNQDPTLARNIESSVDDLRYLYDVYTNNETDPLIAYGRKTLGYQGLTNYLNAMNLDPKSQFIFYRGMIQQKGSVNAVNAFINSRRFEDAIVDEFWAIKLADFGSSAEKIYPELFLTTEDARSNDVRIDFVTEDDLCYPGYSVNVYDQSSCGYSYPSDGGPILIGENGFIPILLTDQTRWFNQPDQLAALNPDGGTMFFTMKVDGKLPIVFTSIATGLTPSEDYVVQVEAQLNALTTFKVNGQGLVVADTTNDIHTFWVWNNGWFFNGYWNATTNGNRSVPVIRHGFKADAVQITIDWYNTGTVAIVSGVTGNTIDTTNGLLQYIPFTNSIELFKKSGGVTTALVSGVDYAEVLDTDGHLLSSQIFFPTPLVSSDQITIGYRTATLVEDLHYSVINSDTISFLFKEIVDGTPQFPVNFTVWGLIEDEHPQNPAKIIDIKAAVVLTPVQIWDPARGINFSNAVFNIDLSEPSDPATYTNSPLTPSVPLFTRDQYWSTNQVTDTWLDTSMISYFRYYDLNAVPNLETRFAGWGALADWASAHVSEWVASDVPPAQWNALAEVQENDTSIPETQRKAGRVNQRLFKLVGSNWERFGIQTQDLDISVEGEPQPNLGLLTGYRTKVDQNLLDVRAYAATPNPTTSTFTVTGSDVADRYLTGKQFGFALAGHNAVYTVASSALSGSDTIITTVESFTGTSSGYVVDLFDVYLNGRLITQNQVATIDSVTLEFFVDFTTAEVTLADHLTYVIQPPTNADLIAAGVTAGVLLQAYEYTQVPYFDNLGTQQFTYYFWVQDKITKGTANRTLSPVDTQIDYVTMPSPYMFFQNVKDPVTVTVNDFPVDMPLRYSQCIIRGLRGLINDDQRYIIRYTRDYTLRDSLNWGKTPLALKNKHQQWELIRPNQEAKVRRALWDEITESIVGFNLTNPTIQVPSLSRQLYDETNGTDTSYGFGVDQAFADGMLALNAILSYLEDGANDFLPIDINLFFATNKFDNATDIISAMTVIYTSFAAEHVNKMFFSVLQHAALTQKYEYPGILKTSMISVTSVTSLQTSTLFDD